MSLPITQLFDIYNTIFTTDTASIFESSGMVNRSAVLDYGFFPLGSGILTANSSISEAKLPRKGSIMLLGNDFGTIKYVDGLKNNREDSNKTILNLLSLPVDPESSFFTNYYVGLRDDVKVTGVKNTRKIIDFIPEFETLCHQFFLKQLAFMQPNMVICLGKEVGLALSKHFPALEDFSLKQSTFNRLYQNNNFHQMVNIPTIGNIQFMLIPHPSYAHINWTPDIKKKINQKILQLKG